MSLTVKHIPVQFIAQTWPLVEKYIVDAQQYGGDDYTVEQVKVYLSSGQWVLIVAVDELGVIHGAATSTFINYPNDRVAFITFIGGSLVSSKEVVTQLGNLLKGFGATKIQGAARESIARLWRRFGFEERYRVVELKV
jgi:hypothetical protein